MSIDAVNIYFKGKAPVAFLQSIGDALSVIGMQVNYLPDDVGAWAASNAHNAYSIFQDRVAMHMRSASAVQLLNTDYWLFNGVNDESHFDADEMSEGAADTLFNAMRDLVVERFEYPFGMEDFVLVAIGPDEPTMDGVRPYTNEQMVRETLDHEPHRQIVVTAVDGVDAAELEVFRGRGRVSISSAPIDRLLDSCAFVVTQDSQIGLRALLHRKHGIQMAACGFHHVLRNPHRDQRIKKSFNRVHRDAPAFEKYVRWLFCTQAFDARKKTAPQEVLLKIQDLGW